MGRAAAQSVADRLPGAELILARALENERQAGPRKAIFDGLIRIGTEAVARALVPMLNSDDVLLRIGAIDALKAMPVAVGACLEQIFAGPPDMRIRAVEILAALDLPHAGRRLIRIVCEDEELNVCAAAVDALCVRGDHEAIEPLLRLLERFPAEPFLEFAVQTALARIAGA